MNSWVNTCSRCPNILFEPKSLKTGVCSQCRSRYGLQTKPEAVAWWASTNEIRHLGPYPTQEATSAACSRCPNILVEPKSLKTGVCSQCRSRK